MRSASCARRLFSSSPRPAAALDSTTCRARVAAYDSQFNAFVRTCPPPPPTVTSSRHLAPLSGRPIAVKDSICTKDMVTGCASAMLKDFHSPYDATVVSLLREAGADVMGKTNCDEFGMGSMNVHSIHGPVVNPFGSEAYYHHPSTSTTTTTTTTITTTTTSTPRSAGGSSGGSAAAVAAGMCYAALGTDTGGSTRLPASYCGIVGLKPSYGLLSRWGVVSFADSLDCVGIMAGKVADVKQVFDVLNLYDEKDPTSASPEMRSAASEACRHRVDGIGWEGGRVDGLRVGIPQEYFPAELSQAILDPLRDAIRQLKQKGAEIIPVSMPMTGYALSGYYVLASAEASSCLARYDGVEYGLNVPLPQGTDLSTMSVGDIYAYTRTAGFGTEVQKRILLGTYALTADAYDNYFLQAQKIRQLVKKDFDKAFEQVDVLVHPSSVQTAPLLNPNTNANKTDIDVYVQDALTVPASLAGVPGISVPVFGTDSGGLPVGVSIVSGWGYEELMFRVGSCIT